MIAASPYMIVFRVVHIAAGIAWAGSAFLFVTVIQPGAAAIAPAGAPLMAELLGPRRLVDRLIVMGIVTVVGGLFLYWHYAQPIGIAEFARTTFGTWLTIGGISAIAALLIGIFGTRPRVMRMLAIGREAAAGGGPTPEQAAEIGALQGQAKVLARTSLALIGITVFAMATARFW